jgi:hypothetical protein
VSATRPVGISLKKTAASIAVPISTSWSGERCSTLTRYSDVTTHVGVARKNSSA